MVKVIATVLFAVLKHARSFNYTLKQATKRDRGYNQLVAFYDGKVFIGPRSVADKPKNDRYREDTIKRQLLGQIGALYCQELQEYHVSFLWIVDSYYGGIVLNPRKRNSKPFEMQNVHVPSSMCVKFGYVE